MAKGDKTVEQIRYQRDHEHADVRVELEVIELYEDIIPVTPFGEDSIGHRIDHLIEHHGNQGNRLGKITIDLRAYSDAFIPQQVHNTRSG